MQMMMICFELSHGVQAGVVLEVAIVPQFSVCFYQDTTARVSV
jgi:hypothetical protein